MGLRGKNTRGKDVGTGKISIKMLSLKGNYSSVEQKMSKIFKGH